MNLSHRYVRVSVATPASSATRASVLTGALRPLANAPHLVGALLVAVLLACGSTLAVRYAVGVETRYVHVLAPQIFTLKLHGTALQTRAFQQPDLLPVYGSSELFFGGDAPQHANNFFASYPTGFGVFSVGRGNTSYLIQAQNIAAVGGDLRGKKAVVLLQTDFFHRNLVTPASYAGNFSQLQAYEAVFGDTLSLTFKRQLATRMLDYPDTLANDALLRRGAQESAQEGPLHAAVFDALLPLGRATLTMLRLQDHWQTLQYIQSQAGLQPDISRTARQIDWDALARSTEAGYKDQANNNSLGVNNKRWLEDVRDSLAPLRTNDTVFKDRVGTNKEWGDLELLLDELRERGAEVELVILPFPGRFYDAIGTTHATRQMYYEIARGIAQRAGARIADLSAHEYDQYFYLDPSGHPSPVGWAYVDQVLDSFYHSNG